MRIMANKNNKNSKLIKNFITMMTAQRQQRWRQISFKFWRNTTKANALCKFIMFKLIENRYKNHLEFAWNKWNQCNQYIQTQEMIQIKQLQYKRQELVKRHTIIWAQQRNKSWIKVMFSAWKSITIHSKLQIKSISAILISNKQRMIQYGLGQWNKQINIKRLKEIEKKMKRKTVYIYLDILTYTDVNILI